ncbi:MAG TPA: hypothetical protein VKG79_17985 [Bryobacteraceae bacterium]|nr:hypothetical protein [Bryobacteraceae bacterium]
MGNRAFLRAAALAAVLSVSLAAQPAPKSKSWTVPRAADGHPDLQGTWTNATLTPMQRPAEFAGKKTLTDAEATAYEKKDLETNNIDNPEAPLLARAGSAETGGYNNLFIDRGSQLARVDGVKRTSLIIDPPDGKLPPFTEEARARTAAMMKRGFDVYDTVKDRPLAERCIVGFGSTSGPPMMPVLYNNTYQIVQNKDTVMILVEMVHDVRVVRMNGTHKPPEVRQWLGDSIGHWEGDTLVVDTTNFNGQTRFAGSGENLHVIERFQRVGADSILYRATIDDPHTFTQQWTVEFPFVASPGPIFEYACHEGNYAMPDILGGARKLEGEKR